jgi:urease accessory protein
VLPGPAIPFRGCRYYQRVAVDLAAGAGLVWGDIWLAGRYARGRESEWFQFKTVIQDVNVQREGQLVFRDRFAWQGPWDETTAKWHFGQSPACGSLFISGALPESCVANPSSCVGRIVNPSHIAEACRTRRAQFPTAFGDTCLRWYGPAEAVVAAVVGEALHAASVVFGKTGVWNGLFDQGLAPVHWFSRQDGTRDEPIKVEVEP